MRKIKKLAVLTSGGDAPGMNAALRAVVRTALAYEVDVMGFHQAFRGLVENDFEILSHESVANCIQRGGTILKTTRYPEFKDTAVRAKAIENLKKHEIDALVVLGGDGSFRGAKLLSEESGILVSGIPCTIDNDIIGTEYTIGFDTARNTALQAIDKIRDTAFSHSNNFLVEVMGRASGFLALDVGIAGGAEYILLPEAPFSVDELIYNIQAKSRFKLGSIIVVAEADQPGRSFALAKEIQEKTGTLYKVCVLGHTQRGGTPSVRDRKVASLMGYHAVKALLDGHNNKMVAYADENCILVNFPDPELGARKLHPEEYFDINRVLCGV